MYLDDYGDNTMDIDEPGNYIDPEDIEPIDIELANEDIYIIIVENLNKNLARKIARESK